MIMKEYESARSNLQDMINQTEPISCTTVDLTESLDGTANRDLGCSIHERPSTTDR
jgi:hypothetical protein